MPEPRAIFSPIAERYDRPAELLSLGGYGRWRRALVDRVPRGARVLDVAAGTGLIARDLERRRNAKVVALDLTEAMLAEAPIGSRVVADARALPFDDGAFEALTFSYLFRYVENPAATLAEMIRVVEPGGTIGSVEFGVPRARVVRAGWRIYARAAFPALTRAFGPGWAEVGAFLPGSIEAWARAWPLERQCAMWERAGLAGVRATPMMLGTGVVMTGTKR